MSVTELIKAVGEGKVQCQFLHETMTNISVTKRSGSSQITFLTVSLTPTQVAADSGPIGLIIWMPREDYVRAIS